MNKSDHAVRLWESCRHIIKDNIPATTYSQWFAPISAMKIEGKTLTLQVPSQFFYEYLEEHFVDLLQRTLYKVIGEGAQLMYHVKVVETDKGGAVDLPQRAIAPANGTQGLGNKSPNLFAAPPITTDEMDSQLNQNYLFENFIAGNSNMLSRSVAEAVAKDPANTPFNPLFIYGVSGVGKTHLCNAIGNRVKALHPHLRVLYVSAHLFQVQYTYAVIKNKTNEFIHFYQHIDVLIIDDIQELVGKTQTQNTFFHIFNHLRQNKKQLILASDRAPIMLQGMEERLITRFKWGMVAELEKPSVELRKDILRNKIFRDGLQFPDDVITFIAEHVSDSVRDLEGVIISLMAHSNVYNKDIDVNLAQRVISKAQQTTSTPQTITIDRILGEVCNYFEMDPVQVQAKTRKRDIVEVRQLAMYLAKKFTDASSGKIGKLIGNRDHATVLHAFKIVKRQCEVDKKFKSTVEELETRLRAS